MSSTDGERHVHTYIHNVYEKYIALKQAKKPLTFTDAEMNVIKGWFNDGIAIDTLLEAIEQAFRDNIDNISDCSQFVKDYIQKNGLQK